MTEDWLSTDWFIQLVHQIPQCFPLSCTYTSSGKAISVLKKAKLLNLFKETIRVIVGSRVSSYYCLSQFFQPYFYHKIENNMRIPHFFLLFSPALRHNLLGIMQDILTKNIFFFSLRSRTPSVCLCVDLKIGEKEVKDWIFEFLNFFFSFFGLIFLWRNEEVKSMFPYILLLV